MSNQNSFSINLLLSIVFVFTLAFVSCADASDSGPNDVEGGASRPPAKACGDLFLGFQDFPSGWGFAPGEVAEILHAIPGIHELMESLAHQARFLDTGSDSFFETMGRLLNVGISADWFKLISQLDPDTSDVFIRRIFQVIDIEFRSLDPSVKKAAQEIRGPAQDLISLLGDSPLEEPFDLNRFQQVTEKEIEDFLRRKAKGDAILRVVDQYQAFEIEVNAKWASSTYLFEGEQKQNEMPPVPLKRSSGTSSSLFSRFNEKEGPIEELVRLKAIAKEKRLPKGFLAKIERDSAFEGLAAALFSKIRQFGAIAGENAEARMEKHRIPLHALDMDALWQRFFYLGAPIHPELLSLLNTLLVEVVIQKPTVSGYALRQRLRTDVEKMLKEIRSQYRKLRAEERREHAAHFAAQSKKPVQAPPPAPTPLNHDARKKAYAEAILAQQQVTNIYKETVFTRRLISDADTHEDQLTIAHILTGRIKLINIPAGVPILAHVTEKGYPHMVTFSHEIWEEWQAAEKFQSEDFHQWFEILSRGPAEGESGQEWKRLSVPVENCTREVRSDHSPRRLLGNRDSRGVWHFLKLVP